MTAATLGPPRASRPVGLDDLLALYAGCDHTTGTPTVPLADAIIRACRPDDYGALRRVVYGDWSPYDVPRHGADCLQVAFVNWKLAGRP